MHCSSLHSASRKYTQVAALTKAPYNYNLFLANTRWPRHLFSQRRITLNQRKEFLDTDMSSSQVRLCLMDPSNTIYRVFQTGCLMSVLYADNLFFLSVYFTDPQLATLRFTQNYTISIDFDWIASLNPIQLPYHL